MSKEREQAERLIERMGECVVNSKKTSCRTEWDGSYIIPGSLLNEIRDFLSSRPEEKEENSTSMLNMNRGDKFHSCQHPLKNRFIDREGFERCSECHGYVENNSNPNNQ